MSAPPSTIDSGRRFVPQLLVSFVAALSLVLGPVAFAPAQAAELSISGGLNGVGEGPLEGASVELQVYHEQDEYFKTHDWAYTDEFGEFRFDAVESGSTYRLRYDSVGSLARVTGDPFVLDESKFFPVVTLQPGGELAGSVLEAGTDKVIATATVTAYPVVGPENAYDYDDSYSTQTDTETGELSLQGLPAGDYLVRISDYEEAHVEEFYNDAADAASAQIVTVTAEQTTTLGTVELAAASTFSGTVAVNEGDSASDVRVAALRMVDGEADYSNAFGGQVDETTGEYTIKGMPAGSYKIHFTAYQYFDQFYNGQASEAAADVITLDAGESKSLGATTMEKEASITGTIEDTAGNPLHDMGVEAFLVTNGTTATESSSFDYSESDGTFELERLHAGTYRLSYFDGLHTYADKLGPLVTVVEGQIVSVGATALVKKPVVKPPVVKPVPKKAASVKVSAKGGKKKATLTVTVKASGVTPTGKITVKLGSKKLKTVTLKRGKATVKLTKQKKGKRAYTVIYSGDRRVLAKTVKSKKVKIT